MNDSDKLDRITRRIIGCAIDVHRFLGPGLLESAYEACLAHDLERIGFRIERQKPVPLKYRDVNLDCGYRLDLLVEECVIVEIKAVEGLLPVHKAQVLSHLRILKLSTGLLINVPILKQGVQRVVNGFPDALTSASSASRR
jgi:GxxExxY protein